MKMISVAIIFLFMITILLAVDTKVSFPDFNLLSIDGKRVSLDEILGKKIGKIQSNLVSI